MEAAIMMMTEATIMAKTMTGATIATAGMTIMATTMAITIITARASMS
jgi:hypothetical protein